MSCHLLLRQIDAAAGRGAWELHQNILAGRLRRDESGAEMRRFAQVTPGAQDEM